MISLVVYFNGENGALRNDLLNIRFFKGSHTGERIAEFTQVAAQEWKIENKIIRIGSDNAANMKKAFDTVLEYELDPLDIEINDEEELEEIDELILTDASVSIFEYLSDTNQNCLTSKLRRAGLLSIWVGACAIYYNFQLMISFKLN